jgi:hypothetical protein
MRKATGIETYLINLGITRDYYCKVKYLSAGVGIILKLTFEKGDGGITLKLLRLCVGTNDWLL